VLEGEVTLVTDTGNRSSGAAWRPEFPRARPTASARERDKEARALLEIGDRTPGDGATYADVDMAARLWRKWVFTHKDGSPYK